MKETLRKISLTLSPLKLHWPHWLLRKAAMLKYFACHGYIFDLDHPKTFTEKILWYEMEYDGSEISRITDKVLFKDFIREKLGDGYTAKLYGAYDKIEDFVRDWDNLPEKVVLKSNLQSNDRSIKIITNRSEVDLKALTREVSAWLMPGNTLQNTFVCRFFNSKPQILAEEFIPFPDDRLDDYKFFCFNGEPYCVYADTKHAITFYDLSWNRMDVQYNHYKTGKADKPLHFDAMVETARKLSQGFPFVRVDMYDLPERFLLGEMTFSPGDGFCQYEPFSFNEELGRLWVMDSKKES